MEQIRKVRKWIALFPRIGWEGLVVGSPLRLIRKHRVTGGNANG